MLKVINLVFALFITTIVFAHGGDDHNADYLSKAKIMIENGRTYHKDISLVRSMHPVFMNHKRDKTLRQGVRDEESSLKSCVNCHGDKSGNKRIDDKGQFCSTCHEKVGTSVDCFSCHKATISIK